MSSDNHFFFIRTLWGALENADWDEASKRGPFALVVEFFRALAGLSAWPFFVPAESGWRSDTIQPILTLHGIESWGWGRQGREIIFQVKLRQASVAPIAQPRNVASVTPLVRSPEKMRARFPRLLPSILKRNPLPFVTRWGRSTGPLTVWQNGKLYVPKYQATL